MQQLEQPLRAYYALTHQVSIQQQESRLNSDYSHGTVLEPAALFSAACGAWSVAIISIVPSAIPSSGASRSAGERSGGFILKRPSSCISRSSSSR